MKYYFVDSVLPPDIEVDNNLDTKYGKNSSGPKKTSGKRKITKAAQDSKLVPVMKLRTIRTAPIAKVRNFPAVSRSKTKRRINVPEDVPSPRRISPRRRGTSVESRLLAVKTA